MENDANSLWKSFQAIGNGEQKRVELTSAITNRMLRFGLSERAFFGGFSYGREEELLDMLYKDMADDEALARGFEAFKTFVPKVPGEIFDRYRAIRHELRTLDIDTLIIGACGLSPLGLVIAEENPDLNVYDTDLSDLIEYRRSLGIEMPSRYNLIELDLLNPAKEAIESIQKGEKLAIVVEGLIFYLDTECRNKLNRNLQKIAKETTKTTAGDATYVFDFYVADVPSRQRDTIFKPEHPRWKDFSNIVSNVYEGQKAFFKSREEVIEYLKSEGYRVPKVSPQSSGNSAHTIFTCKYSVSTLYEVLANRIAAVDAGLITTRHSKNKGSNASD